VTVAAKPPPKIRVLVAEDSLVMRDTLIALLPEDPRIEVVGAAADGVEAVEMARSIKPDVITMDVIMPRLDGLGAISSIMAEAPCRIIVVSSVADNAQVELGFQAISAGALELIAKPRSQRPEDLRRWTRRIAESIVLMAEIPLVTRRSSALGTRAKRIEIYGIVASTGGPPALARLLAALSPSLSIPVIVAQHVTEGFTEGLVRWLRREVAIPVGLAEDGASPLAGHVYFPRDGHHVEVNERRVFRLTRQGEDYLCPSGDLLLQSLARNYGDRAGGVIMTGMGHDGTEGLLAIRAAGGMTMVQDAASCVVFGMPQAAVARGASTNVLSIEAIAQTIERSSRPGPWTK
jgi:two-component system chemotaxis response regulator CheB